MGFGKIKYEVEKQGLDPSKAHTLENLSCTENVIDENKPNPITEEVVAEVDVKHSEPSTPETEKEEQDITLVAEDPKQEEVAIEPNIVPEHILEKKPEVLDTEPKKENTSTKDTVKPPGSPTKKRGKTTTATRKTTKAK